MFWLSCYIEMEVSGMQKNILVKETHRIGVLRMQTNILVKWTRRNGGVRDAKEYLGRVDT